MAAGFLKALDARLDVYSAGTQPAARINPHDVAAMKEVGIDISPGIPKSVNQFVNQAFDYVITVCDDADKNCPNREGRKACPHRLHRSRRGDWRRRAHHERVPPGPRRNQAEILRLLQD
jgi:arsenate reductase